MELIIHGLDEVRRKFDNLPSSLQTQLRLALVKSLRDIKARAESTHQFKSRTGLLEHDGLDFDIYRGQQLAGWVGGSNKVSYFPWVHSGTAPHIIVPREKRALRWWSGGRWCFAKTVHHPGTKGDPYLYRAARLERENVRDNFRAAIAAALKE